MLKVILTSGTGILAALLLTIMYVITIKKDGWKKRMVLAFIAYALFLSEAIIPLVMYYD